MKREELKIQVQKIIERIKLLKEFKPAKEQEKTVLNVEKFEAEILNFLERVNLLPEKDDYLLEGHYILLQRQLDQYKELMELKEYYRNDITKITKLKTPNLHTEVNAYLTPVVAEIKQKVELSEYHDYSSDSELKLELEKLQAAQKQFNTMNEKMTANGPKSLGEFIQKKDRNGIEGVFAFYEASLDAYRRYRSKVEERLFQLESKSLIVDKLKNQRDALLEECEQLVYDVVESEEWNPVEGKKLPNHHVAISNRTYFPVRSSGNLLTEHEAAEKTYEADIALLKEEIAAIKDRKQTLVKAHDEYEKLFATVEEKVNQELEYPEEFKFDSNFQKKLAIFTEKKDLDSNVRETTDKIFNEYYVKHDEAIFEAAKTPLSQHSEKYTENRTAVEKRRDELMAPARAFHKAKKQMGELLEQCQQLVWDVVDAGQWKPAKGFELPNDHVEISTKKYLKLSEEKPGDLGEEYQRAEAECQSDIEKLQKEIDAIKARQEKLAKDRTTCIDLLQKLDTTVEKEGFEYDKEYLLDSDFLTYQKNKDAYPQFRGQMRENLIGYLVTHDKAILEGATLVVNSYVTEHSELKKKVEAKGKLLAGPSMEFHNAEGTRNLLLEQYNQLIEQVKGGDWVPYQQLPRHAAKNYLDFKKPVDLVEGYKTATQTCLADTEQLKKDIALVKTELASIKEERNKQEKAVQVLIANRGQQLPTGAYLEAIKSNHKKYLETVMVTNLQRVADVKRVGTGSIITATKVYAEKMGAYHQSKADYLSSAIEPVSLTSKLKGGALATLLGAVAGGGAFFASKSSSVLDIVNPLAGVKNIVAGGLSGLLGAGVSYAVYQAWLSSTGKVADDEAKKEFDAEMKKVGFTDEKYKELSEEIVKLFHFRECVLLGLKDSTGTDMRKEFKTKLEEGNEVEVNEQALNTAIEVYFLDQLNGLFNNAFGKIYTIHEQEIQQEKDRSAFVNWFRGFFEKPEDRQKFTQQLQVLFMDQCLNYLKSEMNEPGFLAKHPYFVASVTGLLGGALALGVAFAILGGPVGLGLLSIALVATSITAVAAYLVATHVDSHKRSKDNREAIQQTIDIVTDEKERLELLIQSVTETSVEDLKQLQKYDTLNNATVSTFFGFAEEKNVAMGAGFAWIREYASRYRHSKFVEIELQAAHKEVITKANQQTAEMQDILVEMMSSDTINDPRFDRFASFIKDTSEYLDTGNKDFITNFELKNKIKEQVLQIVAAVPLDSRRQLPKELVTFYTEKLGGSIQDLTEVRKIVAAANKDLEHKEHPYRAAALQFNEKALSQTDKRILGGDADYRKMLGLRVREEKIDKTNIHQYLQDSYEFMLSLLEYDKEKPEFDREYIQTDEFNLYKMLLIKQLATLADPNNQQSDVMVRKAVNEFAKKKLGIDPSFVFNQVMNQRLMHQDNVSSSQHIADALVVSSTYNLKKMTPKALVEEELVDFLDVYKDKTKLFYGDSKDRLGVPEESPEYARAISNAIKYTKRFIDEMKQESTLMKSHALEIYLKGAINEIGDILKNIGNKPSLQETASELKAYQEELTDTLWVVSHEANLDRFIADLQKYVGVTKGPATVLSPPNGEREGARELLNALRTLKNGPNSKVVLSEAIPPATGELLSIVNRNLARMGYTKLEDLVGPKPEVVHQIQQQM